MKRLIAITDGRMYANGWLLWLAVLLGAALVALLWTTAASGATAHYSTAESFTDDSQIRNKGRRFRSTGNDESECLCPEIETQPQSQTVSVGSDVTFLVEVTGTEPLAYQWTKDSTPISGAGDPSYSVLSVQFIDAGDYQALSVNPCGAVMSDVASLTVIPVGDYNLNGAVDAADYTVWRDTLGSRTDLRANGEDMGESAGVIDEADYLAWKSHFGQHAGSAATAGLSRVTDTGVPEPATAALVVLAGIVGLQLRCHTPFNCDCSPQRSDHPRGMMGNKLCS